MNPLIGMMHDILMSHVGKEITIELIADLVKFLRDEGEALVENTVELRQVTDDLAVIAVEFPVIWNNEELGQLAAQEIAYIRDSGLARGATKLDMYRLACRRLMAAISPRPEGVSLH